MAKVRLDIAETTEQKRRARTAAKQLAQRGPIAFRKAFGRAIRQGPQAKRRFSSQDLLFALRQAYFEQQFIWTFLRRESRLTSEQLKDPYAVEWASEKLATAYPYLHMKAPRIAQGLVNPSRQAEKDTAEEYKLSESSILPLFSKYLFSR